jgi:hypothetical protein
MAETDQTGTFRLQRPAGARTLTALAPGYTKVSVAVGPTGRATVRLRPFEARGVFQPIYKNVIPRSRDRILALVQRSRALNSVVIDVKAESGQVWDTDVPLARQIGAHTPGADLEDFTREAHRRGVYVIGRVTVFKDALFARKRPDMAIKSTEGGIWKDYGGNGYADPFNRRTWKYFGDLAVEAARKGVDEIQYDYVRFPVDGKLSTARYLQPSNKESRVRQIAAFLAYMDKRVQAERVYSSADIFGLTAWSKREQGTGQKLEALAGHLDYLSPMLYPSGFSEGFNGWKYPTEHSYELIKQSVDRTQRRIQGSRSLVRPWLQSFKDYAWGRPYGVKQVLEQRRGADNAGSSGWLYWNAASKYDPSAFR